MDGQWNPARSTVINSLERYGKTEKSTVDCLYSCIFILFTMNSLERYGC